MLLASSFSNCCSTAVDSRAGQVRKTWQTSHHDDPAICIVSSEGRIPPDKILKSWSPQKDPCSETRAVECLEVPAACEPETRGPPKAPNLILVLHWGRNRGCWPGPHVILLCPRIVQLQGPQACRLSFQSEHFAPQGSSLGGHPDEGLLLPVSDDGVLWVLWQVHKSENEEASRLAARQMIF